MTRENLPWLNLNDLPAGDHDIIIEFVPNQAKPKISKAGKPYNVYYYKVKHQGQMKMCSFFESTATAEFPEGINGANVGDTIRVTAGGKKPMFVRLGQGVPDPVAPRSTTQGYDVNAARVGFCLNQAKDYVLSTAPKTDLSAEEFHKRFKDQVFDLARSIYNCQRYQKAFEEGFPKKEVKGPTEEDVNIDDLPF